MQEEMKDIREKVAPILYYIIIGCVSMLALVFLPLAGIEADMEWKLPNTAIGWVVWIITKLLVTVLNLVVFYCFCQQAKINVKDNQKYKDANSILIKEHKKKRLPRSPEIWVRKQYMHKGTSIAIFTALSVVGLTQAVLSYDWMSLLTYVFVILFGLIFGWIHMKVEEEYWTTEYYEYAIMVEKNNLEELENDKDRQCGTSQPSGTSTEE